MEVGKTLKISAKLSSKLRQQDKKMQGHGLYLPIYIDACTIWLSWNDLPS